MRPKTLLALSCLVALPRVAAAEPNLEERLADLEARRKQDALRIDALGKQVEALLAADGARRAEDAKKVADAAASAQAAKEAAARRRTPFDGDYTWMNGQSKQKTFPFTFSEFVTPSLYLDTYYAFSLNQPKDNTLTGSASVTRHNEFQINLASVGFEWNVRNVIGRLSLQMGSMLKVVQDQDGTAQKGTTLATDALRNVREVTAGYHFDAAWGVNVEAGIFMSYIGLESYLLAENWSYNRSLLSEFTPFYFSGIRAQFYPLANLKIEPWLMNGYQTYGRWNVAPSGGMAIRWNPWESLGFFANFYVGTDTKNTPDRVRFHHDHSILARLYERKDAPLTRIAFSMNNHAGFEAGGGASPEQAHFLATSAALRFWFAKDLVALGGRVEYVRHAGDYSVQYPPPGFVGGNDFELTGVTGTVEIMPTDYLSLRPEFLYRFSNKPFFAGPGGTTSPDGYQGTPGTFVPDVRKDQLLLTLALSFRL